MKKIKYPKMLFLVFTFIFASLIVVGRDFSHNFLLSLGYASTFFAGILYTYSFTAAPATAILLLLSGEQNILLAGLIAGFGALIGDLIIFKFIRHSFADEIEKLSKEKALKKFNRKIPLKLKKYLLPVIAAIIISSPLPDEIGVSLLAASRSISTKSFSLLSYILNTAGIFIILLVGSTI